MEALVAQDGGDVLQAGHRIAQVGAGQPVRRPCRLDRVEGLHALQPHDVEGGEIQLRDQLRHGPPGVCESGVEATRGEVS